MKPAHLLLGAAATAAACLLAWGAFTARAWLGGPVIGDIRPLIGLAAVFAVLTAAERLQGAVRKRLAAGKDGKPHG